MQKWEGKNTSEVLHHLEDGGLDDAQALDELDVNAVPREVLADLPRDVRLQIVEERVGRLEHELFHEPDEFSEM